MRHGARSVKLEATRAWCRAAMWTERINEQAKLPSNFARHDNEATSKSASTPEAAPA
jgi:hypothetical protein